MPLKDFPKTIESPTGSLLAMYVGFYPVGDKGDTVPRRPRARGSMSLQPKTLVAQQQGLASREVSMIPLVCGTRRRPAATQLDSCK